MTTSEFFSSYHSDPFNEFVEREVSKIFQCTSTHREFFEFDDVPL